MLHTVYNALWHLAAPLLRRYLAKRARNHPAYAEHHDERFGKPYTEAVQGAIWIHAVSVGETRAAEPLIRALRQHFPQTPLLLTQMTPTGRATAQTLYPDAQCRYLPYDKKQWAEQFLNDHRPLFGVLMETEIWPNLMHACQARRIPLFLANARLSDRSARAYSRIRSLIRPAMQTLAGCCAQTPADAQRLSDLGANPVRVCGNTKYDITPPTESAHTAARFRQLIGKRRVFLAASTRCRQGDDESALILDAWQQQQFDQDVLLIIVPRHPERFQAAFEHAQKLGLKVQKRSGNSPVLPETQVWIGDSMGEMFAYYQAADAVFVGGSLVDSGCQNIIEPLSCGKAVAFGSSTYNFQAACDSALEARAAVQVNNAAELAALAQSWLNRPETVAGLAANGLALVAAHRGAAHQTADWIAESMAKYT